ncbi:thioesterase [Thioalkalivibrio denitrificans]|uniref:Thioesterase n=1 Tax=Thioalkalivibrio denitrificans TaxID=108003 RepID=A0A1V3NC38_9GAMM|nr:PaaI family thioesterase [Thioalkalivibrio denitrificans]OOG22640.1 thioesterase [Thioalkalivibrio denitrificans]
MTAKLTALEFLQRQIDGTLPADASCDLKYPTAISQLLGFRIASIDKGYACLEMDADAAIHGNQQGTVHGGLLSELADAAIGTAHSTLVEEGESFTSIDLRINFFRPVWKSMLTATARAVRQGRTISHYQCEIVGDGAKLVALASGTIMPLRDSAAKGWGHSADLPPTIRTRP